MNRKILVSISLVFQSCQQILTFFWRSVMCFKRGMRVSYLDQKLLWPFQETIDWRYLPYVIGIFPHNMTLYGTVAPDPEI